MPSPARKYVFDYTSNNQPSCRSRPSFLRDLTLMSLHRSMVNLNPVASPSFQSPPVTLETDTQKALHNPTTRRGCVVTPSLALPRACVHGSEKDSQKDERKHRNSPRPTFFSLGSHSS